MNYIGNLCVTNDYYIKKNTKKARVYFKFIYSINKYYMDNLYDLALLCYYEKDKWNTLRYCHELEKIDDQHIKNNIILGNMHRKYFPNDYVKSKKYYEKVLQIDNNLNATLYIAYLYHDGKGVDQNFKKARELYNKCITPYQVKNGTN